MTPDQIRGRCERIAERAIRSGICERVSQSGTPEGKWKIEPNQLVSDFHKSEIRFHVAEVSSAFAREITPLVERSKLEGAFDVLSQIRSWYLALPLSTTQKDAASVITFVARLYKEYEAALDKIKKEIEP